VSTVVAVDELYQSLDSRTLEILEQRRNTQTTRRRGWLVRRALLVADVVGLSVAFLIAQELYASRHAVGSLGQVSEFVAFAVSLPGWVIAAKLYGLYDKDEERTDHATSDEFVGIFHLLTVCTFLLYAVSLLTNWFNPQFGKLLIFWIIALVATTMLRASARAYCRRHISYLQNTIIVGAGAVGQMIARKLLKHPEYGVNLVGFVDADPKERFAGLEHLTLLGNSADMSQLVRLLDVERVIIAFSNDGHEASLSLIRELNQLGIQVDIVPRFFDVLGPSGDIHTVEGIPMWGVRPSGLPHSSRFIKRAFDIAAATTGLLLLSPVFAVVALLIRLDSRGPVFFRQVRMGAGDETFRIWKFRTMVIDAEERKREVAHLNKHLLAPGGDARMFKIDDDPRVTRVGNVLRRWSLDELPQLFNVLVGDMSLVGPRPLILEEDAFVTDWAERRLDLKPGITGLWQVLGRDGIPFEEMVKLDYLYVTSWSLGGDITLLFRTIPLMLLPMHAGRTCTRDAS
jgi:exopolysaccharide biosynthesis polyprenyl glycosylphosphotransferase